MFPVLLELGPIKLHTYGLMIAVGFLLSLNLIGRDAKRAGLDPEVFMNLAFWVLPLGIAGTRIAYIAMYPQFFSWNDPVGWIAIWRGGLVFQGAIPVVLTVFYVYLRKHGIPFLAACDVIFPYLPLGHAFGRIGCFAYGCCYGRPTDMPWGIPARRVPWDTNLDPVGSPAYLDHLRRFADVTLADHWSHAIHPTQLYSAAGLVVICLVLLAVRRRWGRFTGITLPVYFIVYGAFRFVIEFFRGDHNPVRWGGLTDQQVFAVVIALLASGLLAYLVSRARRGAVSG